MSTSRLPVRIPRPSPEVQPFWDGAARDVLILPRCDDCGFVIWYPRAFCPACGNNRVSWFEASGDGVVYSFSVTRRGQGDYSEAGPYVLAYVELAEGPRVLTNIITDDVETIRIGQAVHVLFDRDDDNTAARGPQPGVM